MEITKDMLVDEIKVLQKAAKLHAKYSISQYKRVLNIVDELEKEKSLLEEKVKQRTNHLEVEIAQKEDLTNKLEKIAKYDQLTGLANRYLFLSELELIYQEAKLLNKTFSLLFLDLDGFKLINDTYGHDVGDVLLKVVSKRIKAIVRQDDMVARLGGDEFTIILRNIDDKEKVKKISTLLIEEIQKAIQINNLDVYVGSSIGIYMFNKHEEQTYHDVISKADIAMYESKKAGKGIYTFFDNTMQKEVQELTIMKHKIKHALEDGNFINYFQPIVSSVNHNILGAEVLIRWQNNGKIISPDIFIPILEDDISLIKDVTFWQLEQVVSVMYKHNIFFSFNISAKLLHNELIEKLEELIQKYEFEPSKIHLEVTETSLSTNMVQASNILLKVKNMGFRLSLDDFGTGYSSLAYLRELSFNILKVDKKFLDDSTKSDKNRKLLLAIINMAKILDMKIILEGIEENHQLSIFEKDKHIKLQGFLFYKPMPYDKFTNLIEANTI